MTPPAHSLNPDFFNELEWRGLVKQVTGPELATTLSTQPVTVYAGFDPTADSLHIGHLLPLLVLRRFQLAGHRPIAVVGGATGMIGDPSGKSAERSMIDEDQLARNVKGITAVVSRFLNLEGEGAGLVVNNADWMRGISFIQFLRDVGKHFTVNTMIAKESVRARLEDREHGISYTEFSYMLLQSYDFLVLNQRHGCNLQIGGSDQWGNITAGTDLIRKVQGTNEGVHGMTMPLVMKADGTKFGKTETGTIWLDPERTSPYQLYQFLIQTADADVIRYLKYFTFLDRGTIEQLEKSVATEPEKRVAQLTLARELTRLIHGDVELARAERASQALFGTSIKELDARTLLDLFAGAPKTAMLKDPLSYGIPLVDALVESGLVASKGAARKEITAGGVYLNNERVTDAAATLKSTDLIAGGFIVLRRGKKTYHLLEFS